MGILADNYKNHPIHQEIETTLKFIDDYKKREDLSDTNKDSIEAYEYLLNYARYVLENSITQTVPTQLLNNLKNNIGNLRSSNVVNIENTYNIYSAITSDLSKIPVYNEKTVVKMGIGKIIENFNKEKEDIKQSITTEIGDFKQKQNDEFEKWQEEKSIYEKQLEELKEENNELTNKLETLKQNITNEGDRLTSTISNFKTDYENKIDSFKVNFEENQISNKTEFEKIKDEILEEFTNFRDKNKKEVDALLTEMKTKQKDVEKLWGIIGKASVSGSSQNYANKAKNFAHFMMALSLIIMIGVIIFIALSFYKDMDSLNFNPIKLLYRIPLCFTLLIPAWYCANIANKQRNREFQLRDFEIKIAGLEPFMENMKMVRCSNCDSDDKFNKKDETKLELVKEIFTNDLDKKKIDDENIVITKDMLNLIQSCLEALIKLKK